MTTANSDGRLGDAVDEDPLEGVSCPVDDCRRRDCYSGNFQVLKRIDEAVGSGEDEELTMVVDGGDGGADGGTEGGVDGGADASRLIRTWILGNVFVLPKMRNDGSVTKRSSSSSSSSSS